jgi:hypothetical protein
MPELSPRTTLALQIAIYGAVTAVILGMLLLPTVDGTDLTVAVVAFTLGTCARFLLDILVNRHRGVRTAHN